MRGEEKDKRVGNMAARDAVIKSEVPTAAPGAESTLERSGAYRTLSPQLAATR